MKRTRRKGSPLYRETLLDRQLLREIRRKLWLPDRKLPHRAFWRERISVLWTERTGGAGMSSTLDLAQADAAPIQPGVIYVHVCGAVVSPGVYELETGSRVYEAVQRAGGFTENAEQNYVNQAQALEDGVKLVIPTREEAAAVEEREAAFASEKAQEGVSDQPQDGAGKEIGIVGGTAPEGQGRDTDGVQDGRININTASAAQLCEIPGVGATRAAAIISYRESHGAFEKPEDIMKVNGIKEGMYEKIKDSISVN